jgi:hypothetical protein
MQKLGLTEFTETYKDLLDLYVTSNYTHYEEHLEFYEDVIFKLFDFYQRSEHDLSVRDLVTPFHIFLHAMFKYKPSVEKNDDELKIL